MIYLDNAATSFPKPERVLTQVNDCLQSYCANPGRGGHALALRAGEEVYRVRELLTDFFHGDDPLRMIFTANCTDSLNLAIQGTLQPGDHAVTTAMEHNSVLRPLHALTDRGVTHTIVRVDATGILSPALVEQAITLQTKLLVVSHASNLTGILNPIAELGALCRRKGILFLVDAAQTAGTEPIDLQAMCIDLLAAPGHKGLMGLQGTGILYVDERSNLRELKQGGTGSRSSDPFQPQLLPDRYESGTLNLPGIVSLGAGVECILGTGIDTVRRYELRLTRLLMEGLTHIPGVTIYGDPVSEKRMPVVSFNIAGITAAEVSSTLNAEHQICTRAGFHCAPLAHRAMGTEYLGAVRMSMGCFNTESEILTAIAAVARIAREGAKTND